MVLELCLVGALVNPVQIAITTIFMVVIAAGVIAPAVFIALSVFNWLCQKSRGESC